jgi:hypothetical protein
MLLLLFILLSNLSIVCCVRTYFAAETGNYTCSELVRWLGAEKHYSNPKKEILFKFLANKDCSNQPVVLLDSISYGW